MELPSKKQKAIDYFNGVADNLMKKAAVFEVRLKKGEEMGAHKSEHQHHEFYKKLVAEWEDLLSQANEYRDRAAELIFGGKVEK